MANVENKEVLLRISNLKQYFPIKKGRVVKANDGISIDIYKGETFGLVGESGCGKSTLGRSVLQLYKQTDGRTMYFGRSIDELAPKYAYNTFRTLPKRKAQMIAKQEKYAAFQAAYDQLSETEQYAKNAGKEKCREMYGKLVEDIMEYILAGKHPNLRLDDNGLLYSNGRDKAVTWMNSTANGRPVVPRTGYIVEFNALWYNALRFCASLAADEGKAEVAEALEKRAEVCKESFVNTFLNEYGYLLDYVDGNMMDWSVRPNMIFACAFDYSPLNQDQKKSVLDVCTRELLTPKGLRSLSPKSGGYNPMYVGPQTQRDYAYHQGTAWPWLGGFYMEACLKLYKRTRLSFIERHMVGFEDEMNYHALGTIPELFDGNPPFHGRGAMSFAMNVAEILRSLKLLEKYTYQK